MSKADPSGYDVTEPQVEHLDFRLGPTDSPLLGGIFPDGSYVWQGSGSTLSVHSLQSHQCSARWALLEGDIPLQLICATEFSWKIPGGGGRVAQVLLASLRIKREHSRDVGQLHFLDPITGLSLRVVDVPAVITCMEIMECEAVERMDRVIGVGLEGGQVWIVDPRFDPTKEETKPPKVRRLSQVTPQDMDTFQSTLEEVHPYIVVNKDSFSEGVMHYPRGDEIYALPQGVLVTAIKYVPSLSALVVGFNFGCFQVFSTKSVGLDLVYSSHLGEISEPDHLELRVPVTHLEYQQIADDKYGMLWVCRGSTPLIQEKYIGTHSIYQMTFQSPTRTIDSLDVRKHGFVENKYSRRLVTDNSATHSRLISMHVFQDNTAIGRSTGQEGLGGFSHALFLWESWMAGSNKSELRLEMFNLNYTVHSFPTPQDSHEYFFELPSSMLAGRHILDMNVDPRSIYGAINPSRPTHGSQFDDGPAHHSFTLRFLLEDDFVSASYVSPLHKAVNLLLSEGPRLMSEDPGSLFLVLKTAGLISSDIEEQASAAADIKEFHQECILDIALDHGFISVICKYITGTVADPTDSMQVHYLHTNMDLKIVLDWGWKKFRTVKTLLSNLYRPFSGEECSPEKGEHLNKLDEMFTCLGDLYAIFQTFLARDDSTTESVESLMAKLTEIQLVAQHLEVMMWFYQHSLIPPDADTYPLPKLTKDYKLRRLRRSQHNEDGTSSWILFIDMMEEGLADEWKKMVEHPLSILDLVHLFSTGDQESLIKKRHIAFYTLMDLEREDLLKEFAATFLLSLSSQQMIHGFWLLDAAGASESPKAVVAKLDEACSALLSPDVKIEPQWNSKILKTFLDYGANAQASRFLRAKQPEVITPEDVMVQLITKLSSGNIHQAFLFQRQYYDMADINRDVLLDQFFSYFLQTKNIGFLFQLPLNAVEDKHLIEFLKVRKEMDYVIVYLMQRSRFTEALQLHDSLQNSAMDSMETDDIQRRAALIENCRLIVPAIQRHPPTYTLNPRPTVPQLPKERKKESDVIGSSQAESTSTLPSFTRFKFTPTLNSSALSEETTQSKEGGSPFLKPPSASPPVSSLLRVDTKEKENGFMFFRTPEPNRRLSFASPDRTPAIGSAMKTPSSVLKKSTPAYSPVVHPDRKNSKSIIRTYLPTPPQHPRRKSVSFSPGGAAFGVSWDRSVDTSDQQLEAMDEEFDANNSLRETRRSTPSRNKATSDVHEDEETPLRRKSARLSEKPVEAPSIAPTLDITPLKRVNLESSFMSPSPSVGTPNRGSSTPKTRSHSMKLRSTQMTRR